MTPSEILTDAVLKLASSLDLDSITKIVASAARQIAHADGATFVLRADDKCYYVDENAISPLWKGMKFPAQKCISGVSMITRSVIVIPDIKVDSRIPQDAYQPTFVKSLCMIPIRTESPIGAIGCYWAKEYSPTVEEIKLLQALADSTATALENIELREAVVHRVAEKDAAINRQNELELQLNAMAHDMRSPLATIMGFTELLQVRLEDKLDEKSKKYLQSMLQSGSRLGRQIDKILAIYRLSNQTMKKRNINLSAIAKDMAEGIKIQYPNKIVEIDITPDLKTVADPDLMKFVLENLISNAFKYSSRKDEIWIRFDKNSESDAEVEYCVEDKGEGFNASQAGELFKPLVRLHNDADFKGTGLGLASVARTIELHGGKVRAMGEPGVGAKFYFSLPKTAI